MAADSEHWSKPAGSAAIDVPAHPSFLLPSYPSHPRHRDGISEAGAARTSRLLTGVAAAAFVAGGSFVLVGFNTSSAESTVILEVDNAVAPVPVTVPPLADTTESVDEAAPTTQPRLSDLVGDRTSAIPEQVEPRPRPVGMEIDRFDVTRYPIRAVGLEPDGELEIPDETEIGWYQYGATAGRPGATVLAAHVSWNDVVGPFGSLGKLEPGDRVSVALDDGTIREYEVFERAIYGKLELPRERIWSNSGPETLVLITCGGDFNPEIRRYQQNIVVYAAPVG